MFGIGLPEILVILAVALIVVGPEKLPELARSLAKGLNELKKSVNQVREELGEEEKILTDAKGELDKTVADLQRNFIDIKTETETETKRIPLDHDHVASGADIMDFSLHSDERPWEKDRKKEPAVDSHPNGQKEEKQT